MKFKYLLTLLIIAICFSLALTSCTNKKEAFCREFIKNANNTKYKNGNGSYVGKIYIGSDKANQIIYFTSADSCGNDTDGFDLCLLYFQDGSIYYEDTKHYCGYEGTCPIFNNFDKTSVDKFLADAKKFGFKEMKSEQVR